MAVGLSLGIAPARAADDVFDTKPPVIQHLAIKDVAAAGPVQIDFTISDDSPLFGVLFHWRYVGDRTYRQIEFTDLTAKQFSARLNAVKSFEFWIEAYDELGNGPATDGTAEKPNLVRVGGSGAPAGTTTTPDPLAGTTGDTSVGIATDPDPQPETQPFFLPVPKGGFIADQVGRFQQARNLPAGRIQVGLDAGLTSGANFLYPETRTLGLQATLKAMVAPHDLVNVGFTSNFSHHTLSSAMENPSSGYPVSASVLNAFALQARFALRPMGPVRLGLLGNLEFPGRVKDTKGGLVISPSLMALISVDTPRLRFHLNAGYKWDNSEAGAFTENGSGGSIGGRASAFSTYALGLSKFDAISVGVAAEVLINKAVPYVGYALEVPVDRLALASCTSTTSATCPPASAALPAKSWQLPQRVVLGLRYEITQFLAVDGGAELSLTKAGKGLETEYSSTNPTATYLPLEGQVLPPPFLFRVGVLYQFGDVRLPWVKRAPAAAPIARPPPVEKPKPVEKKAEPSPVKVVEPPPAPVIEDTKTPSPAKPEEKKADSLLDSLEFEDPTKTQEQQDPTQIDSPERPAGEVQP